MKKLFTLCLLLLTTTFLMAQEDNSFQFVDQNGNVIASGTTLNISYLTEDDILGNYISTGLSVQNTSGSNASLRIAYKIKTLDNGMFQICFPQNCMTKTITGEYVTSMGNMTANELRDLQCEWFPDSYGTCKATLVIEIMNALGAKVADGPVVHVNFQYADPAYVGSIVSGNIVTERFSLSGRSLNAGLKGLSISRLSDGRVVKIITK